MKSSIKYTLLAFVNVGLLSFLFLSGIDEIDLSIGAHIGHDTFQVYVYICAWLVATVVLRIMFRKRVSRFTKAQKWQHLVILFIIAPGYLHLKFGYQLVQRKMDHNRVSFLSKWEPSANYPLGGRADSLTYAEYRILESAMWFAPISKEAKNISFAYYYDGFLPDYSLRISYDVPVSVKVSSYNYDERQDEKNQTVEMVNGMKHVDYMEGRR